MHKKHLEFLTFLVFGYIRNYCNIFIPDAILNIIVKFHGIFDISFDTNIIEHKKLDFMEMLSNQLNKYDFKLKRIYSAKKDSFNVKKFHKLCDNKKSVITIVKNTNDYVFGAYTSFPFLSPLKWYIMKDKNAFLFTIFPHVNVYELIDKNDEEAVVMTKNYILNFGGGRDLIIYNNSNKSKRNYAEPKSYDIKSAKHLVGGNSNDPDDVIYFKVVDIETFQIIER